SAGASELIDIALTDDAQALCRSAKEKGIRIVCTSSDKNNVPMRSADLKKPLMLVIGGEKRGISRAILELADCSVRINYAVKSNIALPTSSAACLLAFAIMGANE
ncbi:MAG TPA: TrmH family RNA methyltransferase, partial [Bacillota bacterium]|nr:TrmH family RNA methyltransferase [Bacillota bacterium]